MCGNRKSSAEESRLIGVDEITFMPFEAIGKSVLWIFAHVHAQKLTWSVCTSAWPCTISCTYRPDRSDMSPDRPADMLPPCTQLIGADHRDHTDHVDCIDHSPVKNDRSTCPSRI
jgi:hypothetical protein